MDALTIEALSTAIATLVSIGSLWYAISVTRGKSAAKLIERIVDSEAKIAKLISDAKELKVRTDLDHDTLTKVNTELRLFWQLTQKELPKLLRSPHRQEYDQLQDKFERGEATDDDIVRMKEILTEIYQKDDGDRGLAARFSIIGLDKELLDRGRTDLVFHGRRPDGKESYD